MSGVNNFISRAPTWIVLAIASGTCAAINGVFAKLTTTSLTSSWSHSLSLLFGFDHDSTVINLLLRSLFFGLNIAFNILMWTLFTMALSRGNSTTRVSIINVSANFMVTAVLGAMIFGEELPGMWWLGAGFLAVGNVIIGRREENEKVGDGGVSAEGMGVRASLDVGGRGSEDQGEGHGLLAEERERDREEETDIIDLGDEDLVGKVPSKK